MKKIFIVMLVVAVLAIAAYLTIADTGGESTPTNPCPGWISLGGPVCHGYCEGLHAYYHKEKYVCPGEENNGQISWYGTQQGGTTDPKSCRKYTDPCEIF